MIYLDNAATSWPKPPCVVRAMADALEQCGANPGRAGHRLSLAAGRIVEGCREAAAQMLGEQDPSRVVFALNATDALNMAIHGVLRTGDHAVATLLEHNSVLRPLSELSRSGVISLSLVAPDSQGRILARDIEEAFQLSHPTVSGILSRLEKKGFIEFRPDPEDRRCKRIYVLQKGVELHETMRRTIADTESQLVSGFSEEEKALFRQFLCRAIENLGGTPGRPIHKEEDTK